MVRKENHCPEFYGGVKPAIKMKYQKGNCWKRCFTKKKEKRRPK
jgi:hypothetical protein